MQMWEKQEKSIIGMQFGHNFSHMDVKKHFYVKNSFKRV